MKKSTITILIFLLAGFFSFSQSYESIFGEQSTQWNMTIGNLWGMGSTKHTVGGDTLINGKKYKMIDGYYHFDGYFGFLREDTITGKAWYISKVDTTEKLIMDLSLEVGDSMYIGGNWNPNPGKYAVDSVYYFNNRKHIRFDFKIPFPEQSPFVLIEGITSNMGFRYQDGQYFNNFNPKLLCSYKNEIQVYGTGPCEIPIQGIEENQNKNNIEIFPNPFSDKLKIQILDNNNNQKKYKILNIHGEQISKGEFFIDKTVNTANLLSGIFIIIVTNEKDLIIGLKKIIKE